MVPFFTFLINKILLFLNKNAVYLYAGEQEHMPCPLAETEESQIPFHEV